MNSRGPPHPQHPYQQPGIPAFGVPGQPGQAAPFLPQPNAFGARHPDPYDQHAAGSFPLPAPQGAQVKSLLPHLCHVGMPQPMHQLNAPDRFLRAPMHSNACPCLAARHARRDEAFRLSSFSACQVPTAAVWLRQGPFLPADPLMAVGTSMLQQSGKTYFESGRRYMQSWTGVVSGGMLHYHFDINTEYGEGHFPCLLCLPQCARHMPMHAAHS